jgi:hypothetical protein
MKGLSILDQYSFLIESLLMKSAVKINKSRKKFMMEVLLLFLTIPGRVNFLQLGRYGKRGEQHYRQHFGRKFDWFSFNVELSKPHLGSRVAIAFDPSYISKSGKCTPYMGKFWSGCAGKVKPGLEISGIGVIDMDLHTCFHLEAVQTLPTATLKQVCHNLLTWYLYVLRERAEQLLPITKYVVADAYFSKYDFAKGLVDMVFHLVSRLRDDAALRYLAEPDGGEKKRGRPKRYDGDIDLDNLWEERFEATDLPDGQGRIFSAVVNSVALKRDIRLCVWESADGKVRKLYFSTDTEMSAWDVLDYYRTRFQIEFVIGMPSSIQALTIHKAGTSMPCTFITTRP